MDTQIQCSTQLGWVKNVLSHFVFLKCDQAISVCHDGVYSGFQPDSQEGTVSLCMGESQKLLIKKKQFIQLDGIEIFNAHCLENNKHLSLKK